MAPAHVYGSSSATSARAARLRSWVIAVGVLGIAGFACSSAYDSWRSYNQDVSATQRELGNMARTLAEQAEGSLQLADLLLRETVQWYEHERPAPSEAANARLAMRVAGLPQVREVRILDAHGIPRFRSRTLPHDDASLSDRAYFVAHRDHPQLGVVVSDPLITQIEGRPAFVMSRRLDKPDGRFDGIVQAVVDLDAFQHVYQAIDLGRGSAITLLREDGTLFVRQPQIPHGMGRRFPEMVATPSNPAGLVLNTMDREPRFVGMAQVRGFPLVVTVSRDKNIALEAWRGEAWHVAVRTMILTLLGAAAIFALVYQLRRVEAGERALGQSEERYALAMEGAREGHFDWNFDGDPSFLSPQMKLLHGRSADAPVTSREAWMAKVEVHADDQARMAGALRDHFEGSSDHYELEYRVRHPDGSWHWLQARGRCVRDASGKVRRFVGSTIDITQRKAAEAEYERLEAQLRQSQKLEAMGTLAGGIAHDFNNILGAILGYGELAQKSAAAGSVLRRYIDNVMHAADRAKTLVERILAFSRSGLGERTPVNVQAVIAETLDLLAASLPARIELRRKLETGDAAVIGDATQLHQVAMNLCTNAVQAMPAGGVLDVRLERVEVREPRRAFHGELVAGPYVRLTVRDSGSGIDPQVVERMFDPFFTTKGVGAGTGLGLSLVHGIVADVGGAIDVASVLDEGTTFEIWLPVSGSVAASGDEAANEPPRGDGELVMVIDDEPALVALAEEMLAELGYEPVGFGSGADALKAFAEDVRRFDLVLTDETMPGLTGTGLALEIRRLRSDIPIIVMSGNVDGGVAALARSAGVREVLRKPLKSRDIAESIARVLHP
jgi:PAS domain S-box-containing protein